MSEKPPFYRRRGVVKRMIFYTGLLIVITLYLSWMGRHALYPVPGDPVASPPPESVVPIQIEGEQGKIHGWLMEPEAGIDETTPIIVFFHGNGENLQILWHYGFFHQVTLKTISLLAVDYPGYGLSEGKPGEAALQDCGKQTLLWVREHFPNRPLIIMGFSLGAAVAIRNAAESGVPYDALVLLSPWTRLSDVGKHHFPDWMVRLFLKETYNSLHVAPQIDKPTLVLHGSQDSIIPETLGKTLAAAIPGAVYHRVPFHGHNDIINASLFWEELQVLLMNVADERLKKTL